MKRFGIRLKIVKRSPSDSHEARFYLNWGFTVLELSTKRSIQRLPYRSASSQTLCNPTKGRLIESRFSGNINLWKNNFLKSFGRCRNLFTKRFWQNWWWIAAIAFLRSVQEKNGGCVFGSGWRNSLQVFHTAGQHSGKRFAHQYHDLTIIKIRNLNTQPFPHHAQWPADFKAFTPRNRLFVLYRHYCNFLPHLNAIFLLFNANSETFLAPTANECKFSATM